MALAAGTHLGPYEIQSALGAGGMGEVYRARDTRLGRDVAIKVLPEAFAADPDRLARFEREAKILASLNHPNIAGIHGIEDAGGVRALVLELVDGPTLADRIGQGGLPLEEALPIARQIAEALEAAHEHGVIHRDLKPANIKVRPDGTVKVLDFGLAKALDTASVTATDVTASPTITSPAMTRMGVILGTAAYMAPEQAKGRAADRRSDIWAFGCVVYEMLTGKRAFGADDVSETLAAVLMREPDWTALREHTPAPVQRLLRRCLTKDRLERFADIADARLDIVEAAAAPIANVSNGSPSRTHGPRLTPIAAGLIAGVTATVVAAWWLLPAMPAPEPVSRFAISLSPNDRLSSTGRHTVAVSPDGRHLAYIANQRLYIRALEELDARPVVGTEVGGAQGHARNPFFSSDGQWVGFWHLGELKKVSINGGAPLTICAAASPWGASWGSNDTIVFSGGSTGIWRVSAAGGTPELLIKLESGQVAHSPQLLPGGNAVLFAFATGNRWEEAEIITQSLGSSQRNVLVRGGRDARYVPTGHLVYVQRATLLAVPFDPDRQELSGGPPPIAEGVRDFALTTGLADFDASNDGSLVYVRGASVAEGSLVWVDRQGREEATTIPPGAYVYPRLSPDGQKVAVSVEGRDIWVYDFRRATFTRLTFEGNNVRSVWTADGTRITFSSNRAGANGNIYWLPADGSAPAERLTTSDFQQVPENWAPDGKTLAFSELRPDTSWDIWTLSTGDREPKLFLRTPFHDGGRVFSRDSRWLAYYSEESGRGEVQVRPFPGPGPKWQISTDGGAEPVWDRSGQEMFYRSGNRLMVVDVQLAPTFSAGTPRVLFEGAYDTALPANFDVSPDGRRFIMIKRVAEPDAATLVLVQHWTEALKRLAPR